MKRLLTGVVLLAVTVWAGSFGAGSVRADLDTLEAQYQWLDSVMGNPSRAPAYDINVGSVYTGFNGLQTGINGLTTGTVPSNRRKAYFLDGAQASMNNEWGVAPFFVGRSLLTGYVNGVRRVDGLSLSDYWRRNVYDTLSDTGRVGYFVAQACRVFNLGAFKSYMVAPPPRTILATFAIKDSTYTDSLECNTSYTGGGLLELYVATALNVDTTAACTLTLSIKGKDYNGSAVSATGSLVKNQTLNQFTVGSRVSIGAAPSYFADITSVAFYGWKNVSALNAGVIDIRVRRDRTVR